MIATEMTELQLDDEVLDNVAVHYTKNNEQTTTESVARQMTELPVEMLIQKKRWILMT